jgi:Ser/Thr protein kinase RdoA (MazF antagonist)
MSGGATGVRIVGDRVHRRTGPWTTDVHELLAHVRSHGVPEAPEVLGFDADGDEILAFIEGDPIGPPVSDGQLASLGDLLRRVRAALATFPEPTSRRWRMPFTAGGALVHGDVSWWNVVFDGDSVVGLLDWDLAGLASPLFDLAYAWWTCAPFEADADVDESLRRARVLVDAFGASDDERARLPEELSHAHARIASLISHGAATDDLGLVGIWNEGRRMDGIGRSMLWLADHREALATALR